MKTVHPIQRFWRHLLSHPGQVRALFSTTALQQIEQQIGDSEQQHAGEMRVVIEAGLPWPDVLRKLTPRQRAIQLFGQLQIWDTEHNNGVLIYLSLADRDVEIVADRGIHRHVGEAGWQQICAQMETMFRQGEFERGVQCGVAAIGALLVQHAPPQGAARNELSNRVLVL